MKRIKTLLLLVIGITLLQYSSAFCKGTIEDNDAFATYLGLTKSEVIAMVPDYFEFTKSTYVVDTSNFPGDISYIDLEVNFSEQDIVESVAVRITKNALIYLGCQGDLSSGVREGMAIMGLPSDEVDFDSLIGETFIEFRLENGAEIRAFELVDGVYRIIATGDPDSVVTIIDSGICGRNAYWSYRNNGILTISGFGDMDDYQSMMKTVPWKDYLLDATEIIIGDLITHIGDYSFCNPSIYGLQTNISKITIGKKVESIGRNAFQGNGNLQEIILPDSVRKIDYAAFQLCTGVKNLVLSANIKVIESNAFWRLESLETLILPNGIEKVLAGAFADLDSVSEINLPVSIKVIEPYSFEGENLVAINADPKSEYFSSIDGVLYNKDLSALIQYPMYKEGANFYIPETVEVIKHGAFPYQSYVKRKPVLENLWIPESVKDIEKDTFSYYEAELTIHVVPDSAAEKILTTELQDKENITIVSDYKLQTYEHHDDATDWVCPSCGNKNHGGNFCGKCGTKRPEKLKCPVCGYEPPEGETPNFCGKCGARLNFSAESQQTTNTLQPTVAPQKVLSPTQAPSASSRLNTGGVDPDMKAFLDSYEAYMDKYIAFMKKYSANPSDMSLLLEYYSMLSELEEFSEAAERYDAKTSEMSAADFAYYMEVMTRINTKMLSAY